MQMLAAPVQLLLSMDLERLLVFFWYTVLFDLPRYTLGAVVTVGVLLFERDRPPAKTGLSVSVILASHNDKDCLRSCIASIAEQTLVRDLGKIEIIFVDDASTDGTLDMALQFQREGKIDKVLRLEQRGSRGSAINLARKHATGDILIIADVDVTFDRDAFAELVGPFADPEVGGVSGNLGVRNVSTSLMTRYQAIEYALVISVGRTVSDAIDTLAIISGGFCAIRRTAFEQVGGAEIDSNDDAEMTMKLRRAGWRIRFARKAHGLNDVHETVSGFIAQRIRWDGCQVRVYGRKYLAAINPFRDDFRIRDVLAFLDVVLMQIVPCVIFPLYLLYLWYFYGVFSLTIIGAVLIGYIILNSIAFGAAMVIGVNSPLRLIPYIPYYTVMRFFLARFIFLASIIMELLYLNTDIEYYVPRRLLSYVKAEE